MTAAARRLRACVRGLVALVAAVAALVAIEYAVQHTLVGLALAAALFGIYVVMARRARS